ncbi:ARID/BRIGHT DNA-binding domain-containing protein, partial [Cynara cardunculus var. scolymus]
MIPVEEKAMQYYLYPPPIARYEDVLEEKKWKEVTNSFSFPPSATNASFILRKYYMSLIHHFEQVYYFKAKAWTPTVI